MADEKVETILSRGIFSTRPRYYYDIYILGTTQRYDRELFFAPFSIIYIQFSDIKINIFNEKVAKLYQYYSY